jgi:amino acid adenylation domain-containing protein
VTGRDENFNIARYLLAAAQRFPDRPAVVASDGRVITYRELDGQARRVAAFLLDVGIAPGDRVGILLPKSIEAVCTIYGTLLAGAAYVPLDCRGPSAWIRTILDDCQCRAIFADPGSRDVISIARRPNDTVVFVPDGATSTTETTADPVWADVMRCEALAGPGASVRLDDLAYILYTSGSTGVPKGVMLTHGNAAAFLDWCWGAFDIHEDDRFASHAPFHFALSIFDLFFSIRQGASLFLLSEEMGKNARQLVRFIATQQITVWKSTPAVLMLLMEFGGASQNDLGSLRWIILGGGVFTLKYLRRLAATATRAAIFNHWGSTETHGCIYARIHTPIPEDRVQAYPIGFPCSHCSTMILTDEGAAAPPEEGGILCISGPSVSPGYWNRAAETRAAFFELDRKRWYKTGDVVRFDPQEGFVYLGRRDRMVKRQGYRIELGEIEKALGDHACIREAAVIAISDNADSRVRVQAFVVFSGPEKLSIIELKTYCAERLPLYMSPDSFVYLDAMPLTSTGKTDYRALERQVQ